MSEPDVFRARRSHRHRDRRPSTRSDQGPAARPARSQVGSPLGVLLFVIVGLAVSPTRAQDFRPGSDAALASLHEHFALSVFPYARRGAQPLGLTGFEVYGELAADEDFESEPYSELADDLAGDLLMPVRVGARKGLFFGIDVGLSFAQVLDLDYEAWAIDVQKAIVKPGALKPGLGLRVAYTEGDSGDVYSLEQIGAELIVSKGFTLVSIFGGVGVVRSEGTFRFAESGLVVRAEDVSSTDTVIFGGIRINLLLPKITVAVEKTQEIQGVLRIAFGW